MPFFSSSSSSPPASSERSTFALLKSLIEAAPALVSDRVHLLSLELRRAMQALVRIVVLVLCAAVLLATAWIALWIALAAALMQAGLAWGWVALIVLLLNGGGAAFALLWAIRSTALLGLPATMRRLTLPPPAAVAPSRDTTPTTTMPRTTVARPEATEPLAKAMP